MAIVGANKSGKKYLINQVLKLIINPCSKNRNPLQVQKTFITRQLFLSSPHLFTNKSSDSNS